MNFYIDPHIIRTDGNKPLTETEKVKVCETIGAQNTTERIQSLDTTQLINANIIEAVGAPEYYDETKLATKTTYNITETGWYIFARVNAKPNVKVTSDYEITGADGYIEPTVDDEYIDIAVRFDAAASSKTVIINWGTEIDTFTFKATDLAVRNIDYRTTFNVYDLSPYMTWTWKLTTDTKVQAQTHYYTKNGNEYTLVNTTVGATIPANTYYVHSALKISGFPRNVTFSAGVVDAPITLEFPSIEEINYGAWFEMQFVFLKSYSITCTLPQGVIMASNTVPAATAGVNIYDFTYNNAVKMWRMTLDSWQGYTPS